MHEFFVFVGAATSLFLVGFLFELGRLTAQRLHKL